MYIMAPQTVCFEEDMIGAVKTEANSRCSILCVCVCVMCVCTNKFHFLRRMSKRGTYTYTRTHTNAHTHIASFWKSFRLLVLHRHPLRWDAPVPETHPRIHTIKTSKDCHERMGAFTYMCTCAHTHTLFLVFFV